MASGSLRAGHGVCGVVRNRSTAPCPHLLVVCDDLLTRVRRAVTTIRLPLPMISVVGTSSQALSKQCATCVPFLSGLRQGSRVCQAARYCAAFVRRVARERRRKSSDGFAKS